MSECLGASLVGALEGLLTGVDVGVLLQVLRQRELFKTYHAHKLLSWLVSGDVSSERESGCELFVAVSECAFVRSSHLIGLRWF